MPFFYNIQQETKDISPSSEKLSKWTLITHFLNNQSLFMTYSSGAIQDHSLLDIDLPPSSFREARLLTIPSATFRTARCYQRPVTGTKLPPPRDPGANDVWLCGIIMGGSMCLPCSLQLPSTQTSSLSAEGPCSHLGRGPTHCEARH